MLSGFLDRVSYNYSKSGGTRLVLEGRDALGMVSDACAFPNIAGSAANNYQFKPSDTLEAVLTQIFSSFGIDIITIDDSAGLTAATGFKMGLKVKGKTAKRRTKSLSASLNHLLKPNRGEGYLEYALRIVKLAGMNIKLVPGTNDSLFVGSPVYDRDQSSPFQLVRSLSSPQLNNILSGEMRVDGSKQPSVIIGEMTSGVPVYRKQSYKVVQVNELTGYIRGEQQILPNAIQSVRDAVESLTQGENSKGYELLVANDLLTASLPNTIINQVFATSRPKYYADDNAHTPEELAFGVMRMMAEHQDKYFCLRYEVLGHSQNGAVWQPNILCSVSDDTFDPGAGASTNYWIRKRTLTKSRGQGTRTSLDLSLPLPSSSPR